jgi:recombination protein RecA
MNERERALDLALTQIEKQFGKGSIMRLGEASAKLQVEVISTGALALDIALGVGGVPRGRVVEIYGPESSGKTTLGYHIIAEAQREGGTAAFIDAEHALDPNYARSVGVDVDGLLLSQPDSGEQALEIAEMLVRSGAVDVVVVDSVAALVPRAELEGEMGDAHVGLQARLMSQALRKLVGAISRSHTTVVFINQIREKIGVMFGNPETTTGGRALKFYASVRMEIRRIENLKTGDEVKGMRARVKVVKNKVAPPFRDAEVDILFGRGISREANILDVAALHGIVQRTGTWFAFGDMKLGQGRDNARDFLESNPELAREIDRRVRVAVGLAKPPAATAPGTAPAGAAKEPAGKHKA